MNTNIKNMMSNAFLSRFNKIISKEEEDRFKPVPINWVHHRLAPRDEKTLTVMEDYEHRLKLKAASRGCKIAKT